MSVTPGLVLEIDAERGARRLELGRRLRRLSIGDRCALALLLVVLIVSFLGPFFAPHNPTAPVTAPFVHPGHSGLLLGSDDLGHDIFSRVLYGARESWLGALAVILFGAVLGTVIGLLAGATHRVVDAVLMRLTDAFLALPAPVLALAIAAAIGRSYVNTLIAVAVVWWPLYARIVRGEVKAMVSRPNIEAARLAGVSRPRLLLRHLLPGAVAPILIAMSLDVSGLILTVSGLSFLGLGSPEPSPELGAMTAQGLPYLLSSSWVCLAPAAAIFFIALASNLGGDAIRDLMED
jgi:peptide/nickel transport system permease protein